MIHGRRIEVRLWLGPGGSNCECCPGLEDWTAGEFQSTMINKKPRVQ